MQSFEFQQRGQSNSMRQGVGGVFLTNGAGTTGYPNRKKERNFTFYTKINSRWITDLNIRDKPIKVFKENIRQHLHDLKQTKISYRYTSK